MKKSLLVIMIALVTFLVACSGDDQTDNNANEENDVQTLRVAAVESPMTDVVEIAKELLAEDGIEVEVVEMGDYIQPNEALKTKRSMQTFHNMYHSCNNLMKMPMVT